MQMTVEIDEVLLEKVRAIVGPLEPEPMILQALATLIHYEAARQLALMGGSEPMLKPIRRRRPGAV